MSRLSVLEVENLASATQSALSSFKIGGKLAPVYNQIANSEAALNAYLQMETALKKSTLSLREIEAIKLLVSEINRCDHCLAVHHFKATAAGLDDETKLAIRKGEFIDDPRLLAITQTVRQFFETPGVLQENQIQKLIEVGLSEAELVDLALVAATIFFTNVFNHINDTKTSLPPAPEIDSAQ